MKHERALGTVAHLDAVECQNVRVYVQAHRAVRSLNRGHSPRMGASNAPQRRTSDGATDCRVIVVQRSTQQAYFLRAPSGVVWTLLALAPDQVLLGETDIAKQAGPLVERLALIRSDSYARWHAPL